MTTVRDVIRRLLPEGTGSGSRKTWTRCPEWPPDLFAVSATLVQLSGCYTGSHFAAGWDTSCYFGQEYRTSVADLAQRWREQIHVPREVSRWWRELVKPETARLRISAGGTGAAWKRAAVRLMAIADEASAGIGFVNPPGYSLPLADLVLEEHLRYLQKTHRLPNFPESLCIRVPRQEVCVQPKTVTPAVGYTLRSFSHHLALLPPVGVVATTWMIGLPSDPETDEWSNPPLNLLVVPFPFRIRGDAFRGIPASARWNDGLIEPPPQGYFEVDLTWLPDVADDVERGALATDIVEFVRDLISSARREVGTVHGVVLPELALDRALAEEVARGLTAAEGDLELFVTGVSDRRSKPPKNSVYACLFHDHGIHTFWDQSKHHRWLLEESQITRYHLGHVLDPQAMWWEKVSIENRSCAFTVFRSGASLAVLVCEDLARIDPVQTAIRAVGPNLVIALLMDGPQLAWRWPGRYATVLADDPGSAVLTLTSLGMVLRSAMPGEEVNRQIALWKEPGGNARELRLPRGDHALLLTISSRTCRARETIDGRSDEGATIGLSLTGVRGIESTAAPPGRVLTACW